MVTLGRLRSLALVNVLLACAASTAGCAAGDGEHEGTQNDAVTNIENTDVKEQFVGTCWLYATAAWAEALHLRATGKAVDISESYWTYWTLYDRVTRGQVDASSGLIVETGSWGVAADIIDRYGLMLEADFIPEEAGSRHSERTTEAMNAVMASVAAGKLARADARKNKALVRSELDAAFGLKAEVVGWLDATFGKDGARVFTAARSTPANGARITAARDFAVAGKASSGRGSLSLADVVGRSIGETNANRRGGTDVWKQAAYPPPGAKTISAERTFLKRVQRALNDGLPVVVAWNVDHGAVVEKTGEIRRPSGARAAVESHLSLITDYQASNVPSFGVLPVGQAESRADARASSLDDAAVVDLLRIKNSWGEKGRPSSVIPPGYYDIFREYYSVEIDACDTGGCRKVPALQYVMLPSGY